MDVKTDDAEIRECQVVCNSLGETGIPTPMDVVLIELVNKSSLPLSNGYQKGVVASCLHRRKQRIAESQARQRKSDTEPTADDALYIM